MKSVYAFGLSVCPSVRLSFQALTLVNILQLSWNLYMLFRSNTACTILKMVYIQLMVWLQRHTKFFDTLQPIGGKCLKHIFAYLDRTKYNEINLSHSHIQRHVSYKKWYKKYKYYVCNHILKNSQIKHIFNVKPVLFLLNLCVYSLFFLNYHYVFRLIITVSEKIF